MAASKSIEAITAKLQTYTEIREYLLKLVICTSQDFERDRQCLMRYLDRLNQGAFNNEAVDAGDEGGTIFDWFDRKMPNLSPPDIPLLEVRAGSKIF